MNAKPHVAIVGATGAVGIEMIKTLEKRNFPRGPTDFARLGQVGRQGIALPRPAVDGEGTEQRTPSTASTSRSSARAAASPGNLRPWRSRPAAWWWIIPARFAWTTRCRWWCRRSTRGDIAQHKGIIANPNCTTAITLMALYPLHQAFGRQKDFCLQLPGRFRHRRQGD